MSESFERSSRSPNPYRVALMAALMGLYPTTAKAEVPECSEPAPSKSPWLQEGDSAKVKCVVDGDTFDVVLDRTGERARIRLMGVDCSESTQESPKCKRRPGGRCSEEEVRVGRQAKAKIKELLKGGKVKLERPFYKNKDKRKKTERTLSFASTPTVSDLSLEQLKNGCDYFEDKRNTRSAIHKRGK